MPSTILHPQTHADPASAFHTSQLAPSILSTTPFSSLPWPLSLLTTSETPQQWQTYENLLLSCLRTGDDESARKCLDHLIARFGADNERVMALKGMYDEAVAQDEASLQEILKGYEKVLEEDPTNMPIRKRRATLLLSLNQITPAIASLTEILDISPTDAESWSELSTLYHKQQLHSQAIFCLEEVLCLTPNAWNIHARLGELQYISSTSTESNGNQQSETEKLRLLSEAFRRLLVQLQNQNQKQDRKALAEMGNMDMSPPDAKTVEKLNEIATGKLAEIVRRATSKERGWEGFDEAEIIAARELLDEDTQKIVR